MILPKNYELTRAIVKAHEKPNNYVALKDRKTNVIGRVTPPVSGKRKVKITLPIVRLP